MFGLGLQEIILILVLVLLVLGPKQLPSVAKALGKGMREFRRASNDLRRAVEDEADRDDIGPYRNPPPATTDSGTDEPPEDYGAVGMNVEPDMADAHIPPEPGTDSPEPTIGGEATVDAADTPALDPEEQQDKQKGAVSGPPEDVELPFSDHLEELRTRLLRATITVFGLFVVTFAFKERLFALLRQPMDKAYGIARQLDSTVPERIPKMSFMDPIEPFFTYLKVAFLAAIFLAIPVILYQLWKFVAPGLYGHERKATVPFVIVSTLMFAIGSVFCHQIVMPFGYGYLLTYAGAEYEPNIMMAQYLSLTAKLLIAFGLVFEIPVILSFLARLGLVTADSLAKFRKYAVVLIFVLGAMLTPPDIITQVMLAIPLVGLYELGIIGARVFGKSREEVTAD